MSYATQIESTTEARRHNGQCEYGEWVSLADLRDDGLAHVASAIGDEVADAMCRDMRREPSTNTDEAGELVIGGQRWVYRR